MGQTYTSSNSAAGESDEYQSPDAGVDSKQQQLRQALSGAEASTESDSSGSTGEEITETYEEDGIWADARKARENDPGSRDNSSQTNAIAVAGSTPVSELQEAYAPPPDELEPSPNSVEELLQEGKVSIGAGETVGVTQDGQEVVGGTEGLTHEEGGRRQADADSLSDNALGRDGSYEALEAAPDSDIPDRPNRGRIPETEFVEPDPDDARVGPSHVEDDPEGTMEIAGDEVPRGCGTDLESQEVIEGVLNDRIERREELFDRMENDGRDSIIEDYTDQADASREELLNLSKQERAKEKYLREQDRLTQVEANNLFAQLSEAQQKTIFDEFETIQERYGISETEAKRDFAQHFMDSPETESVTFEHYPGPDINHPEVDHSSDVSVFQDEMRDAIARIKRRAHNGEMPIHNEDFDDIVAGPHNDYDGTDRGTIKGEVTGVVNPQRIGRDGIKQILYVRHPDADVDHDVKVTIWDSADNEPDGAPGGRTISQTRQLPTPKKGEMVEVDNAKVRIHNPDQTAEGAVSGPATTHLEDSLRTNRNVRVASVDQESDVEIIGNTDGDIDIENRNQLTTNGPVQQEFPYEGDSYYIAEDRESSSSASPSESESLSDSFENQPWEAEFDVSDRFRNKQGPSAFDEMFGSPDGLTDFQPTGDPHLGRKTGVKVRASSSEMTRDMDLSYEHGLTRQSEVRSKYNLSINESKLEEKLPDDPHLMVETDENGQKIVEVDPLGKLTDNQRELIQNKIDESIDKE